ncbi:hypothetical protein GSH19_07140, partial [Lactobacillus sp. S2-2]|nr:hypothetical protein [Lactobacillus sp. S2-2]
MKVFYTNENVIGNKTEGYSINTGISKSFKDKFLTQNFSRVLFTYIPDVTATIDNDLSPIKPDINSHQIKGTATPGAYVRFAGDPAFPEPNIHYEGSDTEPEYHTIADKNGNYSFDLPKDKYFTAGNTITAEASLGGKTYTASKKVKNMPNGDFSSYVTNSDGDKTDSIYRSNSSKLNYTYDNTSGYNITNPKITIELPDNFNFKTNEIESYIDGKFINNDNVKLSKDGNKLVISYSKTNLEENQKLEFTIPFNTDNENKNISIHAKASGTVNPDYYVDNIGENDLTINLLESALELKSVPDLNYGNVNDLSVGKPIKTINSQIVGIKDTYPYVNNWRLELLPTDFYDNEGNKVDFDLRYNEKKLDTTYYNVLYENKKINNGNFDLDLHKGIDLVPASNNNVSRSKEYKSDLNWSITDAP